MIGRKLTDWIVRFHGAEVARTAAAVVARSAG